MQTSLFKSFEASSAVTQGFCPLAKARTGETATKSKSRRKRRKGMRTLSGECENANAICAGWEVDLYPIQPMILKTAVEPPMNWSSSSKCKWLQ
jgi:hypothetical protein